MRRNTITLSAFLLLGLCTTTLAQQTNPVAGGNATGAGGSFSYTVGQVAYTSAHSGDGEISQGVQQAYAISVVSGINTPLDVSLQCTAYPNPTIDKLTLSISDVEKSHLSYQLFDIDGKLLESQNIESSETSINMDQYKTATYFLRVNNSNAEIKTFKIIKK